MSRLNTGEQRKESKGKPEAKQDYVEMRRKDRLSFAGWNRYGRKATSVTREGVSCDFVDVGYIMTQQPPDCCGAYGSSRLSICRRHDLLAAYSRTDGQGWWVPSEDFAFGRDGMRFCLNLKGNRFERKGGRQHVQDPTSTAP